MLKILQVRLQHYMNQELTDVQTGFRKGRETRDQIANIHWIIEKAREFQKKSLLLLYCLHQSLWLCGPQRIVKNSSRDGNTRPSDLPPEKSVCRSRSNSWNQTWNWFQMVKAVHQGYILSPCLFNLYAEYIMQNARLDEAQAGIKIARRNINNLRYADDTTLRAESKEELKSLLMKVEEESEKVDLKLSIQRMKIMASGPITSWQIDGETMQTVRDFIFLDSKITADGDCSHEIKRCLLLGRKAMTILGSILKSRNITLPTKVHLVKVIAFPVVMYGCESWTIKKAKCQRIDAFELWCWRSLLKVPWTASRSNQSILKEISPEYSLEGLTLKLKLQYFGHLMRRTDFLEKIPVMHKIVGRRRRGWQRMRWLDGITNLMDVSLNKL